jgi:alkanesulfonate monooxygenase SsuD/methylene tetrahydromethanopterin reductase-like flavin-dependent oxidoreductase (luciferase family)
MKFGIAFANSGAFSQPGLMGHLATTAERCGFESIWTVEHVAIPVKHTPYPGSKDGQMAGGDNVAIPDPLIPLAYVAAITKTIKLATGILILPQRHPIYTAKEVATLDVLSGGRAILGIGSGGLTAPRRSKASISNSARCTPTRSRCGKMFPSTSAATRRRRRGAPDVTATASFRPSRIRKS